MTGRPHGYARYKIDGCRCYTCAWAKAQYSDNIKTAKLAGTWRPYVDAEPARQHVLQLKHSGIGDRTIARLADLERCQIRALLHGRTNRGTPPPKEIRPATAAAILGVDITLDVLPANLLIGSTGTHRRLQALVALHAPHLTVRNARAVMALYDELWRADPREHGVDNQAYARARNHAQRNGWAPVGAWDDDTIDDPATIPDWTGHCGTPQGHSAHYNLGITPACEPCRAARNEARRAARAAAA